MRAAIAGLLLLLVAIPAQAGGSTAYRNPGNASEIIEPRRDPRMFPIEWLLSSDGIPGSTIDKATLVTELTAAFDAFEAAATASVDWSYGGEVDANTTGLGGTLGPGIDGRNLVTFTDPTLIFPPGVLAVAITTTFADATVIDATNSDLDGDGTPDLPEGSYAAGTIFDGDIAFNSSEPWSVSGGAGTIDVRAVALHEAGHSVGLAHSMIRDAVMWPFLSNDIADARVPEADDIAFLSLLHPAEPAYSTAFGSIAGTVVNGFSGLPILGAHVFAEDGDGNRIVGAYSADDGSFEIPGLLPGDYLVGIEPLDGDPVGLDPVRVNSVIANTGDTQFPEERYDANEAAVEADPAAGIAVMVAAGSVTSGIDLVTNTLELPGVSLILEPGYNLIAMPVEVPSDFSAFDLLPLLGGPSEVTAIEGWDRASASFLRAEYVDGLAAGADFPIVRGAGYVVHMQAQRVVTFSGDTDCPPLDLERGFNLVGIACPPAGYRAADLLTAVGSRFEVAAVESWDGASFLNSAYDSGGSVIGDDFDVVNGRGYVVRALGDLQGLRIPAPGSPHPPALTGLSPGRGVPGELVLLMGDGFSTEPGENLVTFNGVPAPVIFSTATAITTTVPPAATSGPVRVTIGGLSSNTKTFVVDPIAVAEIPGAATPLVSGQTGNGSLDFDGEQDRFTFTALAGSLVTVEARAVSPGIPDTVLLIEDPYGIIVASADDGGGGSDARIDNFALRTTGTHTIVVSNVPGSGAGAYDLTLAVTPRSAVPQVTILGGNYQTAPKGSPLAEPLSVFVTGPTGQPWSGAAVTYTAATAGLAQAATVVVDTDASGIVQIDTTLPDIDGRHEVTVVVNGVATHATFDISASDAMVESVTLFNDGQSGTVGQALPLPLQAVVRDEVGAFVGGALVAFRVVSGGGSLAGPACSGEGVCATTLDTDGLGQASFTLGTRVDEPQIVAAFVPGFTRPLLFEAIPNADAPTQLISRRTNFNRITYGTATLNAIVVEVRDIFDNPVAGAPLVYGTTGGLSVGPGLGLDGTFYPDFNTDENGLHVAFVSAGSADVTINEFEEQLAGPHSVTVDVVAGAAQQQSFEVAVDMGPTMITASTPGAGALIGQMLPGGVSKQILRWQRRDTFTDVDGNEIDDDLGDFTDEDYDSLEQKNVGGVTIDLSTSRSDGRREEDHGLTPLTLDVSSVVTDGLGLGLVNVTTVGDVGGAKNVTGRTDEIFVRWLLDNGATLAERTFVDQNDFAEATPIVADPVTITVEIEDVDAGIDLSTVLMSLNSAGYFNGATPPAVVESFPEPMQLIVGGVPLVGLSLEQALASVFNKITVVWQPAANRLIDGTNMVLVLPVTDQVGHEQPNEEDVDFVYPCPGGGC